MRGQIIGNCGNETPHTGLGNCPKQEGKIVALLVTTRSLNFSVNATEFITGLSNATIAAPSVRLFPIKNIVGMTINGGDINAPDLGNYGGPAPTNLNAKNVAYQIDGGDCLYKELAKFNKRKMRVFRVDDEGYVYGTVIEENGTKKFAGFECTLYANRVPTDGSTAYNLSLYVYYTPNNEIEEKNMNAFEVGLTSIPDGLIGLTLVKGSTSGKTKIVTICGGDDVTDEIGSKLTTDTFLNDSGEHPTTVTYAKGEITIEPAGSYKIADAGTLSGVDIVGFEGVDEYVSLS